EALASARDAAAAHRRRWSQLAVLTFFWIYVALSNILYARSMSAQLDPRGTEHFFAPWTARALQHFFMYPFFLLAVRLSLRVGWRTPWKTVPLQLMLALVFALLGAPLLGLGELLVGEPTDHGPAVAGMSHLTAALPALDQWMASGTGFVLSYGFGLALITGFALYQRVRDSELREAALERAWSGARLAALRMQLSPHTLFNLLHTIRGQIAWDPATARAMVIQLADLLRRLLDAGTSEFSELARELEFVRLYLELQQQRFADRLSVRLPDAAALPRVWVPSLILQPLIENAVVHGLAGHDGPVEVGVEILEDANGLLLRVVNNKGTASLHGPIGIGIQNVRERLNVHFGALASLTSDANDASHWMAEIRLPLLRDRPPPPER
ncbi:MAG: sensor histidine kinase, partial [Steroidobacteraceae bacterium]